MTPPVRRFPDRGLYAITPDRALPPDALIAQIEAAIAGGAKVIQHRCKSPELRRAEAETLLEVCRQAGIPFIVNDDVELAAALGADGVHLGRDDEELESARLRLGAGAIIGVSCYDSVERAILAESLGADYVAFGRFFPSQTKPDAPCAQLDTLRAARQQVKVPIVAIGGIDACNGGSLLAAGAGVLAVIESVFGDADVRGAARDLASLFEQRP